MDIIMKNARSGTERRTPKTSGRSMIMTRRGFGAFLLAYALLSQTSVASAILSRRGLVPALSESAPSWGMLPARSYRGNRLDPGRISTFPRGGSFLGDDDNEEEDAAETDEDESEDEEEEEEEEEDDEEQEEHDEGIAAETEVKTLEYDEPLVASSLTNIYASLGVIILSRKVDLFNPTVVRIARFAFIAYLVGLQIFLLYVRIQAKASNDRTPITLKNPLSSMLQTQLGASGGGNGMVKNLASSFLSSKSTVMDYDLRQARSMQSGLIINMGFMWFLHFKMGQVQPLIIQSVTGISNMIYSPLFQVYVLGRNLERPFKTPAAKKAADSEEEGGESVEDATETPTQIEDSEKEIVEDASENDETEGEVESDSAEGMAEAQDEAADTAEAEDEAEGVAEGEAAGEIDEEEVEKQDADPEAEADVQDDPAQTPEVEIAEEENTAGDDDGASVEEE